jgi:ribosome-associated heat shock protein Hsp15
MDASPAPQSVRADVWLWSIRLYPTRSAATAACKAGHVRLNGSTAKPAHPVRIGDTIRARTIAAERTVFVLALVETRTSAALAVLNYEDRTPAPQPGDERPAPILRDRGAGRPTKRDRRRVERLRGRP